jgi:DNA ligase-1
MSIPSGYKPNLAATLTKPELIKFPVYCSPKIDGIRCVVFDGVAYSRSLKSIPNPFVQAFVKENADWLEGLDGELVVGSDTDPNCMQNSMAVMSKKGEPDFTFHVFDRVVSYFALNTSFQARRSMVRSLTNYRKNPRVRAVEQLLRTNLDDLDTLESCYLADGYEGMMIRNPEESYKFGRSTEREGGLVKVKRFTDAEAEVIGFVEEMHNENEATRSETGATERSTSKAGLVGKGTLGALVCRHIDDPDGTTFNIGTGFTAAQRVDFWERRHEIVEQLVTFKYFNHGIKEAPRHPVFKSFRAKEDMS